MKKHDFLINEYFINSIKTFNKNTKHLLLFTLNLKKIKVINNFYYIFNYLYKSLFLLLLSSSSDISLLSSEALFIFISISLRSSFILL